MIEPSTWLEIASTLDPSAVDGVVVSCAGVRVAGVLEPIEQRLGVPVVASNRRCCGTCFARWRSPRGRAGTARCSRDGSTVAPDQPTADQPTRSSWSWLSALTVFVIRLLTMPSSPANLWTSPRKTGAVTDSAPIVAPVAPTSGIATLR